MYVIEAGSKANMLHCHLITPEYLDWHKMKRIWASILHSQENPHIYVEKVNNDRGDLEKYMTKQAKTLSKYCSKQQTLKGVRTLRSSKNLSRVIENYFDEKKEVAVFAVKDFYKAEKIEWNFEQNGQSLLPAGAG